jgi:hypothetical protein
VNRFVDVIEEEKEEDGGERDLTKKELLQKKIEKFES